MISVVTIACVTRLVTATYIVRRLANEHQMYILIHVTCNFLLVNILHISQNEWKQPTIKAVNSVVTY